MNLRSCLAAVIAVLVPGLATAARAERRCASVSEHREDTVLVIDPSLELTICYHGREAQDVVTGRRVWLQIAPASGAEVHSYRLHRGDAEHAPSGLSAWEIQADELRAALKALAESGEQVGKLQPEAPARPVAAARRLFLSTATPAFHEALGQLSSTLHEVPELADTVNRWCQHLQADPSLWGEPEERLRGSCQQAELRPESAAAQLAALKQAIAVFHQRQAAARDALVIADATGTAPAQELAVKALEDGRAAAREVLGAAERVTPYAHALLRTLARLRDALHAKGRIRPGRPTFLARYTRGGTGVLELEASPIGILAAGKEAARAETQTLTFHFAIVEPHYFDVEVGVAYTGGLAPVPTLTALRGVPTLQGQSVDAFSGMVMLELEPVRFAVPDDPLAGIFRFPVVGIPFTRDPSKNFYLGAGVGWTGVGSITAGPNLVRELGLRSGYSLNAPLPPGASFSAATTTKTVVGFYVSVSVDVLGLYRLFVPVHSPILDASNGRER